jgi:formyl-CoA transferase
LPGIAPTNAYLCRGGEYVLIAGNGDSIFKRLMEAIGRPDLAGDPELSGNEGRVRRVEEIDQAIGAWTAEKGIDEILAAMTKARVPAGRIYSAKDIVEDPHYAARGLIEQIQTRDGLTLKVPGVIPKLSETPGSLRTTAPRLGEDTDAVLRRHGYTDEQIATLRAEKVIG